MLINRLKASPGFVSMIGPDVGAGAPGAGNGAWVVLWGLTA